MNYELNSVIMQKVVHSGLTFVVQKMNIWRFIMADERTEKQKVQEITDKLEEGLKELFESEKYKTYLSIMSKIHNYSLTTLYLSPCKSRKQRLYPDIRHGRRILKDTSIKEKRQSVFLPPAPYKIKEERDKLDPMAGEMMFDENGMPC